ncbi:MAG: hypothetical protein HYZ53_20055 [Planctomycetes bacterium]|nr:hypothetical protein [Planctomycetota bacterium]
MSMRIQPWEFDKSTYERPNQPWVCGWAKDGSPCKVGPDPVGKCLATSRCKPRREGERWVCSNPDQWGGKCTEGPYPDGHCAHPIPKCQPCRSVRSRRGLLVKQCVGLTVGVLVIILAGRGRTAFFSPGQLSGPHGPNACDQCHTVTPDKPTQWLGAAFGHHEPFADSNKCLACHELQLGANPLLVHGIPKEELDRRTNEIRENAKGNPVKTIPVAATVVRSITKIPSQEGGQLACATCHREHHGRETKLTRMTDQQCQLCHIATFQSFKHGHPEFTDYPNPERPPITFRHDEHKARRFGSRPFECTSCHKLSLDGRSMQMPSFEMACASCHLQETKPNVVRDEGVTVLQFPAVGYEGLDEAALQEFRIGKWPKDANGASTGVWTPFAKLFLTYMKDAPAAAKDPAKLADGFLKDLKSKSPADRKAAVELLSAYKDLLAILRTEDARDALGYIFKGVFGDLKASQVSALAGTLKEKPFELGKCIDMLQDKWCIPLSDEKDYREGKMEEELKFATVEPEVTGDAVSAPTAGWWELKKDDHSLRYSPAGHADPFLRAWLEETGRVYLSNPLAKAVFDQLDQEGRCTKCHNTYDLDPYDKSKGRGVAWSAGRGSNARQSVAGYSHQPHLLLPRMKVMAEERTGGRAADSPFKVCQACHTIDAPESAANEKRTTAGFLVTRKERCAECHVPERVGDNCLICHKYHQGKSVLFRQLK